MKQAIGGMIIGVPLFLWGFVQYRKSRAAALWPAAQGAIVGATVESEFSRGGEDEADSCSYYPAVQYHYAVGQRTYQGNRIRYRAARLSEAGTGAGGARTVSGGSAGVGLLRPGAAARSGPRSEQEKRTSCSWRSGR